MRTWGRITNQNTNSGAIGSFVIGASGIGGGFGDTQWVEVTTDENGFNDAVWLTTLAQVLKLGLNESPFFGNYGIPAQQSVVTQIPPDYYVTLTQQLFSQYFLALTLAKIPSLEPQYAINATANPGAILQSPVPV